MNKAVNVFILSVFITTSAFCQLEIPSKKDLKQITKDVKILASDKMEGRETGTQGEQMAAEYIADRMESMGLKPYGIGGYFQEFTFTPKPRKSRNPHAAQTPPTDLKPITGKNVIGYLDNGAEYTVVIGAHYDHLGMGGEGSRHTGEPAIHNGADDNASGIAAMLFVAKMLKSSINMSNNNYLFIAFSGEEKGLWGSKSFVNNPTIKLEKINYMVNMDMVGRLDSNKLAVNGVGTSSVWDEALANANKDGLNLVKGESGIGPSDHTSFYLKEIPVVQLFTGQHHDYHKPSDDFDLVNMEGIGQVGKFVYWLIYDLNGKGKLDYKKTKSDKSMKAPSFKVTLGVMPDYMYQGSGMKIDGTIPERPAAKAGLEAGDVVIKMGDVDVEGMQSYMKALSKFEAGQTVPVIIKRGGKEMTMQVTF